MNRTKRYFDIEEEVWEISPSSNVNNIEYNHDSPVNNEFDETIWNKIYHFDEDPTRNEDYNYRTDIYEDEEFKNYLQKNFHKTREDMVYNKEYRCVICYNRHDSIFNCRTFTKLENYKYKLCYLCKSNEHFLCSKLSNKLKNFYEIEDYTSNNNNLNTELSSSDDKESIKSIESKTSFININEIESDSENNNNINNNNYSNINSNINKTNSFKNTIFCYKCADIHDPTTCFIDVKIEKPIIITRGSELVENKAFYDDFDGYSDDG